MKTKDISDFLESIAPLAYQEKYDNAGLICGDRDWDIIGVLIALDITEAVVQEALDKECNMIVTHHPLIFSGLKKITGSNHIERALIKAIKNDIAIYAIHTNLDNMYNGVSKRLADKLGLVNTRVLQPMGGQLCKLFTFAPHDQAGAVRNALFDAGAGQIGQYAECSFNTPGTGTFRATAGTKPFVGETGVQHHEPETRIEVIFPKHLKKKIIAAMIKAHPYEEVAYDIIELANHHPEIGAGIIGQLPEPLQATEFLTRLKAQTNAEVIRHTDLGDRPILSVALCGGSGSFLLDEAKRAGADIFISADFKYHQFFDADGQIVICDIGHYETEQFTTELLHELLTEKFTTFAVLFTGITTNPIKYFT